MNYDLKFEIVLSLKKFGKLEIKHFSGFRISQKYDNIHCECLRGKYNTQAFPISIQLWDSLCQRASISILENLSTHRTHLEKILIQNTNPGNLEKFTKKHFLSTNESRDKDAKYLAPQTHKTAVKQDVFLMKDIVLMKVCHRPPNKYLHSWDDRCRKVNLMWQRVTSSIAMDTCIIQNYEFISIQSLARRAHFIKWGPF